VKRTSAVWPLMGWSLRTAVRQHHCCAPCTAARQIRFPFSLLHHITGPVRTCRQQVYMTAMVWSGDVNSPSGDSGYMDSHCEPFNLGMRVSSPMSENSDLPMD
jgi:hypothetical protein